MKTMLSPTFNNNTNQPSEEELLDYIKWKIPLIPPSNHAVSHMASQRASLVVDLVEVVVAPQSRSTLLQH
jgi:hypothetical protein